jgi:hypothetical protein
VHLDQVADTGAGDLGRLLAAWESAQLRLRVAGMTAKEALKQAEMDTALDEAISSAPCKPSARSLGRYLTTIRERVVAGRRFVPSDDGHGTQVWSVVRVDGSLPEPEPEPARPPWEQDEPDQDAILASMLDDD